MDEPAFVLRTPELRAARGVTVATDVALTAAPGDVVAVEGPNGSGKSTLLAAAAGLLPATNATVRPPTVGFSPERASVLPRVNVLRWLTGLARTAGLSRHDSAAQAADVLRRLGLESASGRSLHVLSRGNAQRALVMAWLTVQAHRVEGRELARAFAAHVGGRVRAHVATDLCLVPFALLLTLAAVVWPLASQGGHHHPGMLLLRLSTATVTNATPVGTQVAWLCVPGVLLAAAAALLAIKLN